MPIVQKLRVVLNLPHSARRPDHRALAHVQDGDGMETSQGDEYLSRLELREFPRARLAQDLDAVGMEEVALGSGLHGRLERCTQAADSIIRSLLFGDRRGQQVRVGRVSECFLNRNL